MIAQKFSEARRVKLRRACAPKRAGRTLVGAALAACIMLAGGACKDEPGPTEILLKISSEVPVDSVEIRARNIDNDQDTILKTLGKRSIVANAEPLFILIVPTKIAVTGEVGFFVHARGFVDGAPIVAGAANLVFVEHKRVEGDDATIAMINLAAFSDADNDGFTSCRVRANDPLCDCEDRNPNINPFTHEICLDEADNNCSGFSDEGCPCSRDEACTPLQENFWHLAGIGICELGTLACVDGVLSTTCVGATGPQPAETQDNFLDDDCDGAVDEGTPCSPGDTRNCFMGWVDYDDLHMQATERALGVCRVGTQYCGDDDRWENSCSGEVRPQAAAEGVGYAETLDQCDGLDNDCDGLYDEQAAFDFDDDGFNNCGTCVHDEAFRPDPDDPLDVALIVDPTDPTRFGSGLCPEDIDCDDDNPARRPHRRDDCATPEDDDCRCDHDAPPGVQGLPIDKLAGGTNCAAIDAQLNCQRTDRDGISANPVCSDGVDDGAYYAGYYTEDAGAGDCYYCGASYGRICDDSTGACSSKEDDCGGGCDTRGAVAQGRPFCATPVPDTCLGTDGPQWTYPPNEDPGSDCPSLPCSTVDADNVAGPPYYFGIYPDPGMGGQKRCFYAADVPGMCSGQVPDSAGNGSCLTQAQECSAAPRGSAIPDYRTNTNADPFHRPLCQEATTGCSGESVPAFAPIPRGTDPFDDCPGTCDGFGACNASVGAACGSGVASCEDGVDCVDGVCCAEACDSVCQACSSALTGLVDGTCANINARVDDTSELPGTCAGNIGCALNDCTCASGQGLCKGDSGAPCTTDSECSTTHCECSNADCTARVCSLVDCDSCRFNTDGDDDCEGKIADGADDAANTCGSLSCDGNGGCNTANGDLCTTDTQCESNHCECFNDTCTVLHCSPVACLPCRYNPNASGSCGSFITDGSDDKLNTCVDLSCNGSGSCNKPKNTRCVTDAECESNQCECSTANCNEKKCSLIDCDCRYNSNGDSDCEANIADDHDDADGMCGAALGCNGRGSCNIVNGGSCSGNQRCKTNQCECQVADCTSRVCSAVDCPDCRYNPNGDSSCELDMNDGVADGDNACPGGRTCDGQGACHKGAGASCTSNSECETDECECADSSCTSRKCSVTDCPPCTFSSDGVSPTCQGLIADQKTDADGSCGGLTCDGAGACHLAAGVICTADSNCESNECECVDSTCSTKRCNSADCLECKYDPGSDGTCEGNIANGSDDADNTCGARSCNGAGACKVPQGNACPNGTSDCSGADQCECAVADCNNTADYFCTAQDCPPCKFNGNPSVDAICEGNIARGFDDFDDSCGSLSCAGTGACHLDEGIICTANAQCQTNECECANGDCSVRRCSAQDCPTCKFNNNGDTSCEGDIDDGVDDADNNCGLQLSCNGSGACNKPKNTDCGADFECESDYCECTEGTCSLALRKCSQKDCDCTFNGNGDTSCEGDINDGKDDPDNSCGSLSCNGSGNCHLPDGGPCSVNADCQNNHCECADATCSTRRCSPAQCLECLFNGDGFGGCEGNLADTIPDGNGLCDGSLTCNGGGACHFDNNVTCTLNSDCESNECECANGGCTIRECSLNDCGDCTYNSNGDGVCELNLDRFEPDGDNNCPGGLTCDGFGGCHSADGVGCTANATCNSNQCECSDATCGSKKCSASDCPECRYSSSGFGACTQIIAVGSDNADADCSPLSCSSAGLCRKADEQSCTTDAVCESGKCRCADASCATKVCSPLECACSYYNTVSNNCNQFVQHGTDDAQNSCASNKCDGKGGCTSPAGVACTSDNDDCESRQCECADSGCGTRLCSDQACLSCRYTSDGFGACDGNMGAGVDDFDNTCGVVECNGNGACQVADGNLCPNGTNDCISNICVDGVCCDALCFGDCVACDQAGSVGICSDYLANTDPDGDCGVFLCDGFGVCLGDCEVNNDAACAAAAHCDVNGGADACVTDHGSGSGATCEGGQDCVSGFCVDGYCCNTNCAGDCAACDIAGSLGTCAAHLVGTDPESDCTSANTFCDGSGACFADCEVNDDNRCVGSAHCVALGSPDQCVADVVNGVACEGPQDCNSTHCADGVCCDAACGGDCVSCALSGSVGTCSPYTAGTDPDSDCVASRLLCDGSGACYNDCEVDDDSKCVATAHCEVQVGADQCIDDQGLGTSCNGPLDCASGFCVDGVCCGSACAGACSSCNLSGLAGTCSGHPASTDPEGDCTNDLVCNGSGACYADCNSDDDSRCQPGAHCDAGTNPDSCVGDLADGGVCDGPGDCISNKCVDGVCCNSDCGGDCEACDVATLEGTCTPHTAGTDPEGECGLYVCAGSSTCNTNCESNDDALCDAAGAHCTVVAGANNDICEGELALGLPCDQATDCISGICATDWDGAGKYCSPNNVTCIFDDDSTDTTAALTRAENFVLCGDGTFDGFRSCVAGATATDPATWSSKTNCDALPCDPDGAGSEDDTCGYAADAQTTCNSGLPGGCVASGTCTDCGSFTADGAAGACNSGVTSCSTTCGSVCNNGDTSDLGSDYCHTSLAQTMNLVGVCDSSCAFADDADTSNDTLATACAPYNCDSGSDACWATCNNDDDAKCAPEAFCDGPNTCLADLGAGAACVNNGDCMSGSCNGGSSTCDFGAAGTPCLVGGDCVSNSCTGAPLLCD